VKLLSEFKQAKTPNVKRTFRKHNWTIWACNLLRRRKIAAWPDFCGMGQKHLVGTDIIKVGNGCAFKSLACDGCSHGKLLLDDPQKQVRDQVIKDNQASCQYLVYYYIPYKDKVKPGDIVNTNPASDQDTPPISRAKLGTEIAHITV
jgi:hypothetical protein